MERTVPQSQWVEHFKKAGFSCDIQIIGKQFKLDAHNRIIGRSASDPKQALLWGIRRIGPDTYTMLTESLIQELGDPLHLPALPASLTYSLESNAIGSANQDAGRWLDRRGMMSCLGSNLRTYIASQGPRKAITSRGFGRTIKKGGIPECSIKYVHGNIVAKAGNWFLYSQRLAIWDPYEEKEKNIVWVGLASCMSYSYFTKHPDLSSVVYEVLKANPSLENRLCNPFQRWASAVPSVSWTANKWNQSANQDTHTHKEISSKSILEILSKLEVLLSTPQGIQLQRIEETYTEKKTQLKTIENQLQIARAELAAANANIQVLLEQIKRAQKRIENEKQMIVESEKVEEELEPRVTLQKRLLHKIEIGLQKKRDQFEAAKNLAFQNNEVEPNDNYAEGLARSGLVIDELWYTKKDNSLRLPASKHSYVITSREWRLSSMDAHTTRPIKIHFGIENESPRASGPHKLSIACTDEGAVTMKIGALVPWSAAGWQNKRFKPYPHTGGDIFEGTTAEELERFILNYSADVCLGELSAIASQAFATNNPKNVALAVLGYLQSVNPDDTWGAFYKHFPLWSDVIKDRQISEFDKYKSVRRESVKNDPKYYLSSDRTRFLEITYNRYLGSCDVRFGDLEMVNGEPIEKTSNLFEQHYSSSYLHPRNVHSLRSGPWHYMPFISVVAAHRGIPDWHPSYYVRSESQIF